VRLCLDERDCSSLKFCNHLVMWRRNCIRQDPYRSRLKAADSQNEGMGREMILVEFAILQRLIPEALTTPLRRRQAEDDVLSSRHGRGTKRAVKPAGIARLLPAIISRARDLRMVMLRIPAKIFILTYRMAGLIRPTVCQVNQIVSFLASFFWSRHAGPGSRLSNRGLLCSCG
jgi:hypothetical protein